MSRIQMFLTVNQGKWLIAKAILEMEPVRTALREGRLILKGGTTVACLASLMKLPPLRISGRMTPAGALSAKKNCPSPHILMVEGGNAVPIDGMTEEILRELSPADVVVTGANLIDSYGGSAMLAGSPGGGGWGSAPGVLAAEGATVLIAAGLEKLIPGRVEDAVSASARKGVDSADGMACGLFPLYGRVISEPQAAAILSGAEISVIGRGGIQGAEGGVLLQASGTRTQLEALTQAAESCRDLPVAGDPGSLEACTWPAPGCANHLSCRYRRERKSG